MKPDCHLAALASIMPNETTTLYNSEQVYAMEQAWFTQGHDSFGLMQQAAWQMAQYIQKVHEQKCATASINGTPARRHRYQQRASIWVGKGNNGGDGWLLAHYLQRMGWQVQVVTVGFGKDDLETDSSKIQDTDINSATSISDAESAKQIALAKGCRYQRFEEMCAEWDASPDIDADASTWQASGYAVDADVYIDAIFGIGLDRAPAGIYQSAIYRFNQLAKCYKPFVIAVDIPSGLVAATGEVFAGAAIQADITLCLVARKFGLHTKDGMDYSGQVVDIALIPYALEDNALKPVAKLITSAYALTPRQQNSYKGSYGHVLIIGGNRVNGSQGMGGAAILSASSAMATGAGKITVACHEAFHAALLTSLPDAMTINLHDADGVMQLLKGASVIAIGMGLGRDDKAKKLFVCYLKAAIIEKKPIVIDADGLYHLADLHKEHHPLIAALQQHSAHHSVCLTPHSGEAAKLLGMEVSQVESDRLAAIRQCATDYGGDWVLKGAGSLVLEQREQQAQIYVCAAGNAGMATAGMGDVLSGLIAGLLAQKDLIRESRGLQQAVLLHGMAGDMLINQTDKTALLIGQRGLQAQDMPAAIRHVMQELTVSDDSW